MTRNYSDQLIKFYRQSPLGFGVLDIYCFEKLDSYKRIGELISIVGGMKSDDGRFGVSEIVIVLPAYQKEQIDIATANILGHASFALDIVYRNHWSEADKKALSEYVRVVSGNDLECDTAMKLIDSCRPNSIVVFLEAASYRNNAMSESRSDGQDLANLPEDVWPEHLRSFAVLALLAAQMKPCYVVLDAGLKFPLKPKNQTPLLSIDGTGVLAENENENDQKIIAEHVADWRAQIGAGQLDRALQSIDNLLSEFGTQKQFVKIQLLDQAGLNDAAMKLLRQQLETTIAINPELAAMLAKISCNGGDYELAKSLISGIIPQLISPESLKVALSVASKLDDRDMDRQCFARLRELYPDSSFVQIQQVSRMLNERDYNGLAVELKKNNCGLDPEKAVALKFLLAHLSAGTDTEYMNVVDEIKERWPDFSQRAQLICINDALASSRLSELLILSQSLETQKDLIRESVLSLINVVERLLLGVAESHDSGVDIEELRSIILRIVKYVAGNPADGVCRNALTEILSVPMAGSLGLPVIVAIAIDLARHMDSSRANAIWNSECQPLPTDEFFVHLKGVLTWLEANSPILLGRAALPRDVLEVPVEAIFSGILTALHESGKNLSTPSEVAWFEKLVFAGVLVTANCCDPSKALEILQLGSSYLALSGRVQRARDLIETVFLIAGSDPYLLRVAWFSVADVYQRLGRIDEAMIAMSSALSLRVCITRENAWSETYLLMRLFRDLHLFEEARSLIPAGRALLDAFGARDLNECRLESLEQSIRLLELLADPAPSLAEVQEVAATAVSRIRTAVETSEEVAPAVMLVAQIIRLAEMHDIPVPPDAVDALDAAIATLGEPFATIVKLLKPRFPTCAQVVSLLNSLEKSRYSEDVGFDIQKSVLLTRRLLDSDEATRDPIVTALAVEVLADHAINLPEVEGERIGMNEILLLDTRSAGEYARQISEGGTTVVMQGIGESGSLIRVVARDGCLEPTERQPTSVFSNEKFARWGIDYPYKYAEVDDAFNGFRTSMEGVGFTFDTVQPTLLIMDTRLQQLPPNILIVGDASSGNDDYVGRKVPIGVVPSLSWLMYSRKGRAASRVGLHAWISISGKEPAASTLKNLEDRLHDTFEAHGIQTYTSPGIPNNLAGSELVLVGAHGGLDLERQYFHVISDEGDLRMNSNALADALHDVGLVVLFVCSGGRLDSHPNSHTVVGLTKQLLNVGCSAIVASPWPLEVTVASHWLPEFLRFWFAGESVMTANFHANRAVARALGDSPGKCLAMSVFGDPLLTREDVAHSTQKQA